MRAAGLVPEEGAAGGGVGRFEGFEHEGELGGGRALAGEGEAVPLAEGAVLGGGGERGGFERGEGGEGERDAGLGDAGAGVEERGVVVDAEGRELTCSGYG